MQWLSSRCYTARAIICPHMYQPPSTDQGQIWYTGVCPHILLNCPIFPSSVDSVATYSRKTAKLTHFSNFEFAGGRCTSTNLPLSNGTKLVSQLQLLHGDMAFTNSVFPKEWWTKKHQTFCSDGGVQSPNLTKLGMVMGRLPHFGWSKTCPLQLFATRGHWKCWGGREMPPCG